MADENDVTVESLQKQKAAADSTSDSIKNFTEWQKKASEEAKRAAEFITRTGQAFINYATVLSDVSKGQRDSVILMQKQSDMLGLLGGLAFGATKAFEGFGNISGVNTFSGTLSKAVEMAKGLGKGAGAALEGIAKIVGIDPKTTRGIEDLSNKILATGERMADVADVGLRMQTGFLQMTAAGGGLGRVFEQSGSHLGNLNNLLQQQVKMISSAAETTNTSTESVVQYYNALGRIPGYLNTNINRIGAAGAAINMLSAAIKIANATGQSQETIIQDLTTAYTNYNANGEKALEFTARISKLSQEYNIQLDETRAFMADTSLAFKFLGENIEGTSSIFERFFGGLRETGLSARGSREIVEDYTKSISNLTIAQKAFLSARTGGPGGLMGALQIEQEIRSGDLAKVSERIQTALRQQFGRIVTQEEGARSPGAAAQFVRQRMFLQQGPFGQIFGAGAEGEAKATRFLEAMTKTGGQTVDATKLLKDTMERGTDVTNRSLNPLTKMVPQLENIRMMAGVIALNTAQKAFGPGAANAEIRRQLVAGITDSMKAGTEAVMASQKTQQDDTSALEMTRTTKGLMNTVSLIGESAKSGIDAMAEVNKYSGEQAASAREYEQTKEGVRRSTAVGRAATESLAAQPTRRTGEPEFLRHMTQPTLTPQHITVHVEGICPDCHKKFAKDPQKAAINNAPEIGPGF